MLFINYRRSESMYVARALAEALRYRFGPNQVFLDETSIPDGQAWPATLEGALQQSTILLSLIGPDWLRISDRYGRRRLDDPADWVRKELLGARDSGKTILLRMVGGNTTPIGNELAGLPDELKWLAEVQCKPINDTNWHDDVEALVRQLIDKHGFQDANLAPPLPTEKNKQKARSKLIDTATLLRRLDELPGWVVVENQYPARQELRKMYQFDDFIDTIEFMKFAAKTIQTQRHHPRWENQFRSLTVHFSTWDAGARITEYDFTAAKNMDSLFADFRNNSAPRQPK